MWVVCGSCDLDQWYGDSDGEIWTCPNCGEGYDETELFELDAYADGPDCAPGFDETTTTRDEVA
jgi:hypothetical protein